MQKRALYLSQVIVVWSSQMLLSVLLTYEILSSSNFEVLSAYPSSMWIVVSRFICAIVLHMCLQDELIQGLKCMKYVLNHMWRFDNWKIAFWAGFLQASSIFIIEVVNFLAIMTST